MRFQRVHVQAFGPFRDGSLEFAPGFTVVFGPNEAGKTTWHAALYAAFCGIRRARGAPTREDAEFAALHRPWAGDGWQASVTVERADGARVEIRQDLRDRVECTARDLDLGADLTAEIVREGTPDGSVWLGLDRGTFLATACVRQADVLACLNSAGALQEHLQRAAATGGRDETAAAALTLLEEFEREQVGRDQVNSTRPLRRAKARLEEARAFRDQALREHESYLEREAEVEQLEAESAACERQRAVYHAAWARRAAAALHRDVEQAASIQARLPLEDPSLPEDDRLAREVEAALSGFRSIPEPAPLGGVGAAQLKAELDALPETPSGDLEPAPDVVAAFERLRAAEQALAVHDRGRPSDPGSTASGTPTARRGPLWPWLVAGGVFAVLGIGLFASGSVLPGLASVLVGGLSAAVGAVLSSGRIDSVELQRRQLETWRRVHSEHERECTDAAAALRAALQARGATVGTDADESYRVYRETCTARMEQARAAVRRGDLLAYLHEREELEERHSQAVLRREQAVAALRAAAAKCGANAADDDGLARELSAWLGTRSEDLERRQRDDEDRNKLSALLAGGTLDDLRARARSQECLAVELSEGFDPMELDALPLGDEPDRRLTELSGAANDARVRAARARGEVTELSQRLPSVPAAEEEAEAAELELERVQRLASTLRTTRSFLEAAETRVHRDVAPRLKAKLEAWLPRVTCGRYQEAAVNPETLEVHVRAADGEWRDATRLSLGTREQVYLLLRVALVEHLGNPLEPCPLVLDEVTVQSDATRTSSLLDLLHEISQERQVVLFTQENDVLEWAGRCLAEPHDRLVLLDPNLVPA